MTHYIRCPECAFIIGAYQAFVDKVRLELTKKAIKDKYEHYDPDKLIFTDHVVPDLQELFDAVGIENRCCRMHLVAKTDFNNYL
jgi:hypothetical protein